jgi:hypothetical protein
MLNSLRLSSGSIRSLMGIRQALLGGFHHLSSRFRQRAQMRNDMARIDSMPQPLIRGVGGYLIT